MSARALAGLLVTALAGCDVLSQKPARPAAEPGPSLDDAATDAGRRAGSVDAAVAEPTCLPRKRPPEGWSSAVVLPWAADPQGLIFTSSILAATAFGQRELLVSETALHQISILSGCSPDCAVQSVSSGLIAPVRARPIDFDRDGDRDVLVADIGVVVASSDPVGRVVLMDNDGSGAFSARVLLDGLGRVSCAEPSDLDHDGDEDIVVCEFGAAEGAVFWLERVESGALVRHELSGQAGAIHAFPFDADDDGDTDLAVALSQVAQQVALYRNDGSGTFAEESIFRAGSEGFGLTGIELTDLDQDGDTDVLVVGGDYIDETFDFAEQGLWWLSNRGDGTFTAERIASAVGGYGVRAADMDGDCDRDLVLAQMLIEGTVPDDAWNAGGLSWLENDGAQRFVARHRIEPAPPHALAVEVLEIDGQLSLFTGSMTFRGGNPTHQRLVRLSP